MPKLVSTCMAKQSEYHKSEKPLHMIAQQKFLFFPSDLLKLKSLCKLRLTGGCGCRALRLLVSVAWPV